MTKTILKDTANLSPTIKNYLNKHSELNKYIKKLKNLGLQKQRKQKEYNTNKKKVA